MSIQAYINKITDPNKVTLIDNISINKGLNQREISNFLVEILESQDEPRAGDRLIITEVRTVLDTAFSNTPIGEKVIDFETGWTQGNPVKDIIRVSATGVGAISGSTGTQPYFHAIYRDNEIGISNYAVIAKINFFKQISNSQTTGIMISLNNITGDMYIFGIKGDDRTLVIAEVNNNIETIKTSIPYIDAGFPIEGNTTKTLRVDVTADEILGYVDDVLYLSYSHSGSLHGNNVGLRAIKGIGNIQTITFKMGGLVPHFQGKIDKVDSPIFNNLEAFKLQYKLKVIPPSSYMGDIIVNEARQNITVTDLLTDLFNIYIEPEGIILGVIDIPDVLIVNVILSNRNLEIVLNELAERVNCSWTITTDTLALNFIQIDNYPELEKTINENFKPIQNLHKITNYTDFRNSQVITGSKENTSTQNNTFIFDGSNKIFTLDYALAQKPIISEDKGAGFVTIDPNDIGIRNINNPSVETNILYLFSFNNAAITLTVNNTIGTNNLIKIEYIGLFDIRLIVSDDDDIEKRMNKFENGTGRVENVVSNNTLFSKEDTQLYGLTHLQRFLEGQTTVKFSINQNDLDDDLVVNFNRIDVGVYVNIELPAVKIVGKFLIIKCKTELFNKDINDPVYIKHIEARTGDFLTNNKGEIGFENRNKIDLKLDEVLITNTITNNDLELNDNIEIISNTCTVVNINVQLGFTVC